MKINDLSDPIESVYSEKGFMLLLETHFAYLRGNNSIRYKPVTLQQGYKFEGAFYDLLNELGIERKYHYVTARLNNYVNATDYKGDRDLIAIPSPSSIEQLRSLYETTVNY